MAVTLLPYIFEVFFICYSLRKAKQLAENCGVKVEKKMMVLHLTLLLAVVLNVTMCNIILSSELSFDSLVGYLLSLIGMVLDCLIEVLIAFLILKWSDPETVDQSRKFMFTIIENGPS